VKELDTQLEGILEKLEKSTLTAYRYHMLKVQKDLLALKKKSNEEELKTQQEAKLSTLDKQIREIREECMNTRGFCDEQEKTIS
jgi:DNA repair photolyase